MADSADTVFNTIHDLLKNLVDYPDDLNIEQITGDTSTIINIKSSKSEDVGKLIGKGGKTIKALRIISKVVGSKDDKCVTLNVID